MTVTVSQSKDSKEICISVSGRFDYDIVQEFRSAYDNKDPTSNFTVDLSEASYLGSSGIGSLIHLWKFTGQVRSRITIKNCNPSIKKLLTITNLDDRFTII